MADNSLWEGTIKGIRIDPANNGITCTNEDTVGFEYIRVEATGSEESGSGTSEKSVTGIIPGETNTDQILDKNTVSEKEVKGIMEKVNDFIEAERVVWRTALNKTIQFQFF